MNGNSRALCPKPGSLTPLPLSTYTTGVLRKIFSANAVFDCLQSPWRRPCANSSLLSLSIILVGFGESGKCFWMSYAVKGARGKTPVMKKLHMWLRRDAYSVRDGYLHITGGYKAKIVGMEQRYEEGEWKEAKLAYRGGDMYLYRKEGRKYVG